ncbi:hypothetical protein CCR75_000807 [Bremia lactucae]|uniref:FH2 domain-containing protein n=1 Tax=Bremia lactucae TaxID=4779 RepID=A0A976NXR3_BRELC|nr:hypothetical protein CCR75_000807 [Bremia lactucae]
MAPSFIAMLLSADKRAPLARTASSSTESSTGTLPHLSRTTTRTSGLQFGLPLGTYQHHPLNQPPALAPSSNQWNDRQKVHEFFHPTSTSYDNKNDDNTYCADTKKAGQTNPKAIDVRTFVLHTKDESHEASTTSLTSSEDHEQSDDGGKNVRGPGRLQSALDDLLVRQQEEDDSGYPTSLRRRYDSFDNMADVQIDDDDGDDYASLYSTPARSRTNSEDFYGPGLLEFLSQRHLPVGLHRQVSKADLKIDDDMRAPTEERICESLIDEQYMERPEMGSSHVRNELLSNTFKPVSALENHVAARNSFDTKEEISQTPATSKEDNTTLKKPFNTVELTPTALQTEITNTDVVPLKDHPLYQKYFQMLKVGLPMPVVKHKMQSDNVDPTILDMDPTTPPPRSCIALVQEDEEEATFQAQLKEYEANHGKYVQMVQVGLPVAVVEHKMRMDGVDVSWLQGPPTRPKVIVITEDDRVAHRQKYHKYFQMLRMGLPRGAVEQKMRMAGIDPMELHGPCLARTIPSNEPPKVLKRKNSIRKKLHWEGKKHRTRRDSLWGRDSMDTTALESVEISHESRVLLEKLFVKDLTEKRTKGCSTMALEPLRTTKKKAIVQLLEMKKAQNIAITLARVKLSFSELTHELLAMNATVLSSSQLCSLLDMWPDRNEMEAINAFQGDVETLGTAEQFLREVGRIPRFQEKLKCLVFMQEFPSRKQELMESLEVVIRGLFQVCSSTELRQVFMYILQIGNLLNVGGDDEHQKMAAFSLNSLVKFSQTKAFVGGITFLQYVVQSIDRDVPHLAHFDQEIDLIGKCSKVAYASLALEKRALEKGLQLLVCEAEALESTTIHEDLLLTYKDTIAAFITEVKTGVASVQGRFDALGAAKAQFLEYFEEEETEEELDVLLTHIANFTTEFGREHSKYHEKIKQEKEAARRRTLSISAVEDVIKEQA